MNLDSIAAGIESAIKLSRLSGVFSEPSHEDLQALFAALPFEATRPSAELHPHRAALSDALREKGRDQEADLVGDPSKKLRPEYHDHHHGWMVEEEHPLPPHHYNPLSQFPENVSDYLSSALFSEHDTDGSPLEDRYSMHHFSKDAVERAHHDIHRFYSMLSPEALNEVYDNEDRAARHLWLTRQGHGHGFWAGDWEHGDELTDAAHKLGEQYIDVEHHGDTDPDREDEYTLHLHGGK